VLINLGALVTRIRDILASDARTSGILWHDGRRSIQQVQGNPAGTVCVDTGEDVIAYIGGLGREATINILVSVRETAEKVGNAEKNIQNWLDNAIAVLAEKWDLNAFSPTTSVDQINFRTDSNPEADPPEARFTMTVVVKVRVR
jgi:hypothetical protein